MNRPRIAVIVSAVAASTAVFFVTSRYQLGGTLAGAALFPVIIILVSHSSTQGVDALHRWVRRRRKGEPDGADAPEAAEPREAAEPSGRPTRPRGRAYSQWWLAGLAGVAISVSVYTLVAHGDPAVVRQTVIQRITESSEVATSAPSTSSTQETSPGGTTATTAGTGATSTTTSTTTATTDVTDTTDTTSTTTPPSETTTTTAAGGEPSTTETAQQSGTTLP